MIILMSKEQMCKKYNKLVKMKSLDDFVIVNATNSPQFRDFANVLTDVEMVDEDQRSYKTGISAMAFQMSAMIFDETEGSAKRNNMLNSFFTNDSFEEMFILLLAKQLSRPSMNIFLCIEDNAYEMYADEYLHAFGKICGIEDAEGVVFLWNDIEKMEHYLKEALEYRLDHTDHDDDDDYNAGWEEDVLLDLRDADSNKVIRKLFFKYMYLCGKIRKTVAKAVKEYVDNHDGTIGDTAGRMIKKATDGDHKKKKKHDKHKKHRRGDNIYDDYEYDYDRRKEEDDDDEDEDRDYVSRRDGSLDQWVRKMGKLL